MGGIPVAGGLLGQLAVSRGLVTPDQLRAILELHARDPRTRLGDLLVAQGLLTPPQLQALLADQTALQARLREDGPVQAAPPDAAAALDNAASTLARGSIAKKTPAQVEAELAAQKKALEQKRAQLEARQKKRKPALNDPLAGSDGRKIDLDLGEDDSPFEIETLDGTKTVERTPSKGFPAARDPAPAPAAPLAAPPAMPAAVPASPAPASPPVSGNGRKLLSDLVLAAARAMASDLHLHPGYPLMIRQHGRMVQSPTAPLAAESLEPALRELLSDEERAVYDARGQVATTFVVPNVARCRLLVAKTAAGASAVFRLIPFVAPNLSSLGLPTTLARFVAGGGGLVLVAGPASCGKTWTLAALVDIVNSERREHIVCIERPIEFVHLPKRCVVSQREVPTQARDISRAVRAALHEDADVLVLGELEDAETLRLAITAAEGGTLVLATVAAGSTARALARLVGMFPSDQQALAAAMLAGALRGVVAQRLVPSADGSRRLPVCELLEIDAKTEAALLAGRVSELRPATTFDQSLTEAVKSGRITREDARRHADQTGLFS